MAGRGRVKEVEAAPISNRVVSANELPSIASAFGLDAGGSFVQRAREHLRALQGFSGMPAEFEADPRISRTSSGGVTVHLRQQFKSIPVFLGSQAVRFQPDGQVASAMGNTFSFDEDTPVEPRLTSAQAALAAARHATELGQSLLGEEDDFGNALQAPALDLANFQPEVVAVFPELPAQPTVLAPGPFAHPIKASLIWVHEGQKLVLCWEVLLTMPGGAGQYRVLVDASTGEIRHSRQLMDLLIARASVFVAAGPPTARQILTLPRPWTDYAAGFDVGALPPGVPPEPMHWLDDGRADTFGNCALARLGDGGPPLAGRQEGEVVVFEPAQPDGDDQKVLNIFYYNSYLHDLFYLLGFREEDGNFQAKGVGGVGGDAVDARAHSGPVWGTANMLTPPDGSSPTMNMGLVAATSRHTAFDASVVFHEYMHGVTNRLVGGPMNTRALESKQSKAMGEGWGDYLACTLTGKTVVGDWVTAKPAGIRSNPYDDTYAVTYGQVGTGEFALPHRAGEVWCAALLAMNRNLNQRLGTPRGQRLGLQLVVDALKISPANPSMIDMRDAILAALDHKRTGSPGLGAADHATALGAIWTAFARYGMGDKARCATADYDGLVEDRTPRAVGAPAEPVASPGTGTGAVPGAGGTAAVTRVQESERVQIPDNAPLGIARVLRLDAPGRIRRAQLRVNIMHPYVGDLLVRLTPPAGTAIVLHKQAFKETPDLVATYATDDRLAALVGRPAQGEWVLSVADNSPGDTGVLRGWSLEVEMEGAPQPSGFEVAAADADLGVLAGALRQLTAQLGDLRARVDRVLGPR